MTLEKAHELIATHSDSGGGYDQNAACMVQGEIMRNHSQEAVDSQIREYDLEKQWEIKPGTKFTSAFKS